jgi:hypothetical protein
MNVGLASLQSNLINYSARQHVFKPIILLVAGIALAIFCGALIGSVLSRSSRNRRSNHAYHPTYPSRQNTYRTPHLNPSPLQAHDHGVMYPTQNIFASHDELISKPYSYIKNLAQSIRSTGPSVNFRVGFKNPDGTSPASDAGGPTRQFFNLLFHSLKKQFTSEGAKPEDFHPHINKTGTFLVPQGKPTNNHQSSIFYDIGTVMMYVYFNNRSPLIGPVFHTAFFAAILSLDDKEIHTPYDRLTDATKFKICKALINAQQASGENFDDYLDVLTFLDKGDEFTEDDLNNVNVKNFYAIRVLDEESRDFLGAEGDEFDLNAVKFDWKAIEKDKKGFFSKYLSYLLQQKTDSLGTVGLILFPVHTMAQAMKAVSKDSWTAIRSLTSSSTTETSSPEIEAAKRLQRKIQGVLDREVLVSKITMYATAGIVKTQADWIKAWILDPATTDTLIEGLLTFWTGSSYIDWDKVESISISADDGGLLPRASTCSRMLYVSNTHSKENDRGELGLLHNHTAEGYYQVLNKIASEYSNVYTHC